MESRLFVYNLCFFQVLHVGVLQLEAIYVQYFPSPCFPPSAVPCNAFPKFFLTIMDLMVITTSACVLILAVALEQIYESN